MAKIMLVEDDNNLREIYEARLLAEGYEIVSAHDGEEALAMAVKEKPDLIISDVMMPKISGFDMLDILRTTPETKNTKVIMMTALSQTEDKDRADKLGADRYLVKSQVTLEDVARVAREVLEGTASPAADSPTEPATATPAEPATPATTPTTEPGSTPASEPAVAPVVAVPVVPAPADPDPATSSGASTASATPAEPTATEPIATPETPAPAEETASDTAPSSVVPEAAIPSAKTDEASTGTASSSAAPKPVSGSAPTEIKLPSPAEQIEAAPSAETEQKDVNFQIEAFLKENAVESDGTPGGTESVPEKHDLKLPGVESPPAAPSPDPASATSAPEIGASPLIDSRTMATTTSKPEPSGSTESSAQDPTAIAPPAAPETPAPATEDKEEKLETADYPEPGVAGKKVIQPINDPTAKPDLNALLAKEEEREQVAGIMGSAGIAPPPEQTPAPGQETKPQNPNDIAL